MSKHHAKKNSQTGNDMREDSKSAIVAGKRWSGVREKETKIKMNSK